MHDAADPEVGGRALSSAIFRYRPQTVTPKRSRMGPIGEAIAVPLDPPPITIPTGWNSPSFVTTRAPESPKSPKAFEVRICPVNRATPEGNVIFTLTSTALMVP